MANVKTLTDENRLDLNLDKYDVYEVMPGHYDQLYPNLANFLIAYYESLENEDNPAKLVNDLLTNRDVVSVRAEFLGFLSNELLLGKPYFEQFKDKRTALQFSNLLYRSKGTEYSIQQFFRIFYSIDVDVSYGRDFIFNVGEPRQERLEYITRGSFSGSTFRYTFPGGVKTVSVRDSAEWHEVREDIDYIQNFTERRIEFLIRDPDEDGLGYVHDTPIFHNLAETGYIGFDDDSASVRLRIVTDKDTDSLIGSGTVKRLTNDKFYQLFALMIQTPVSTNIWREAYKTFIHPAGMYLESRVQILSVGKLGYGNGIDGITIISDPLLKAQEIAPAKVMGKGLFTTDITELFEGPYGYLQRSRINDMTRTEYPNVPSDDLLIGNDHSTPGWGAEYYEMHRGDEIEARTLDDPFITLSNTINTLDENMYLEVDSDGMGNPWLPGTIDWRPIDNRYTAYLVTEDGKFLITEDGKKIEYGTFEN